MTATEASSTRLCAGRAPGSDEPHESSDRPPAILVLVPLLIVAGTLVLVVRSFANPLGNADTFFHLRIGHEFLSGWTPWDPKHIAPFSSANWYPTQWLSQVTYAQTESWIGLPGVAWLSGTVVIAFVLTVAITARQAGGLLVAALVTVLAVIATVPYQSARPQVASYLLVVLFTAAWLRSVDHRRTPWWMIPATWLWAMLHGMWVAGVLLGLVAALGLTLDRGAARRTVPGRMANHASAGTGTPLWHLWAVPLLSLVSAGLTPVGPGIYSAAFRVGGISQFFDEWSPPSFTDPFVATGGLMLALVVLIGLRRGARSWLELLLIALASAWLVYSYRSTPIAVAMLIPMLASALGSMVPRRTAGRREARALIGLGVAASLALGALVPFTATQTPRHDNAVSAAVASLPSGTALLNEWGEGGIDMWLYPHLDVVMHGYGDMFTDAELRRNSDLSSLEPHWDEDLRALEVTHALLNEDSKLAYALMHSEGWTVEAEDDELTYLIAPDGWLEQDSAG